MGKSVKRSEGEWRTSRFAGSGLGIEAFCRRIDQRGEVFIVGVVCWATGVFAAKWFTTNRARLSSILVH